VQLTGIEGGTLGIGQVGTGGTRGWGLPSAGISASTCFGQQSGRQDSNSVGLRSQDLLQSWAHGLRLQGGRGVGAHSARLRGPRIVVPPGLELGLWRRDLWLHVGLSSAYRVGDCRVGFYLRLWLKEKENYLIFYFYFYFLR
jgi:hypothetical protein